LQDHRKGQSVEVNQALAVQKTRREPQHNTKEDGINQVGLNQSKDTLRATAEHQTGQDGGESVLRLGIAEQVQGYPGKDHGDQEDQILHQVWVVCEPENGSGEGQKDNRGHRKRQGIPIGMKDVRIPKRFPGRLKRVNLPSRNPHCNDIVTNSLLVRRQVKNQGIGENQWRYAKER
jgi:hypothetical protein